MTQKFTNWRHIINFSTLWTFGSQQETDIVQLYVKPEIENGNDGTKVLFNSWVALNDSQHIRTILGR